MFLPPFVLLLQPSYILHPTSSLFHLPSSFFHHPSSTNSLFYCQHFFDSLGEKGRFSESGSLVTGFLIFLDRCYEAFCRPSEAKYVSIVFWYVSESFHNTAVGHPVYIRQGEPSYRPLLSWRFCMRNNAHKAYLTQD